MKHGKIENLQTTRFFNKLPTNWLSDEHGNCESHSPLENGSDHRNLRGDPPARTLSPRNRNIP